MNTQQSGFTMLELMLSTAVVGILATLAIPIYQDYIARSQVSEAIHSIGSIQNVITEYGLNQGEYPNDSSVPASSELSIAGHYGAATVQAGTGAIIFRFYAVGHVSQNIADKIVVFTPPALTRLSNSSGFKWDCETGTTVPHKLLPKSCF